jgi:hypothetical protein
VTTRFADHIIGPGTHASRPAATAVPAGTVYACTTDSKLEQSNGSAWSDYFSGGAAGITVQDEGSALATAGTTLNFTGAGVTASGTGATKTVNIPGGGGGGSSPYGLDTRTKNATYGDDFAGASLDAKWTRHNQTSGEETYQAGGSGSALQVTHGTTNAAEYIYQAAPNGTNETWEASVSWYQETTTLQMFALLMVDTSGNGVAALVYDATNGLYLANVASHTYSSALASNTNLALPTQYYQRGGRLWLKLRKATGLYGAAFSLDGETYSREVTGTPSAFTPARVGIGRILGTNANSIAYWHWFDKTA